MYVKPQRKHPSAHPARSTRRKQRVPRPPRPNTTTLSPPPHPSRHHPPMYPNEHLQTQPVAQTTPLVPLRNLSHQSTLPARTTRRDPPRKGHGHHAQHHTHLSHPSEHAPCPTHPCTQTNTSRYKQWRKRSASSTSYGGRALYFDLKAEMGCACNVS